MGFQSDFCCPKLRVELSSAFETQGAEFEAVRLKLAEVEKEASTAAASERSRMERICLLAYRAAGPLPIAAICENINMLGRYSFSVPDAAATIQDRIGHIASGHNCYIWASSCCEL